MSDEREEVTSEDAAQVAQEVETVSTEAAAESATEAAPSATESAAESEVERLKRERDELLAERAARSSADETRRADPPTIDPARASELAQTNRQRVEEYERLQREALLLEAKLGELADSDPVAAFALNQSRQQAIVARANLEASHQALHEAQVAQDEAYIERTFKEPAQREGFRKWLTPAQKSNFLNVESARKAYLGELYESSQAELEKQKKQAAKVIANKDRAVVATGSREVTSVEATLKRGEKISGAAFDAHYRKLADAGRWDEAAEFSAKHANAIAD